MSLENTVGNIVRGMAVASSLYSIGCGTTIHVEKGGAWHDCNTNEDYPQRHPCYASIEQYRRQQAAVSPRTTFSPGESSGRDFTDRAYGERRGGQWRCRR